MGLAKNKEQDKKTDFNKLFQDFARTFAKSLNFLIFSGYSNILEQDYETYKEAMEDLQEYERMKTLQFATGIGLVFGGKKAIDDFFRDSNSGQQARNQNFDQRKPPRRIRKRSKGVR